MVLESVFNRFSQSVLAEFLIKTNTIKCANTKSYNSSVAVREFQCV